MRSPSSTHQTRLGVIDDMTLSVECHCGHAALVAVSDLLERHDGNTTVNEVLPVLTCSHCGRKGDPLHARIVFMLPEHREIAHRHAAQIEDDPGGQAVTSKYSPD